MISLAIYVIEPINIHFILTLLYVFMLRENTQHLFVFFGKKSILFSCGVDVGLC